MKTRKWPSLLLAVFTVLSFGACDDWGQMDPAAGNQIYPKLELKGEYKFEEELSPEEVTLIDKFVVKVLSEALTVCPS